MTEAMHRSGDTPNERAFGEKAYQRLLPELLALSPGELMPVNRDVPFAVATVLNALPELLALAPDMVELPGFDVRLVKNLELYALALSHASALREAALHGPLHLEPLVEEGGKLRARLLADAKVLVQLGLIDERALQKLSGSVGFKNLATDLQALAGLLRGSFERLGAQYPTAPDELVAAERVAGELLHGVALREKQADLIASTTDLRTRAWTLLKRAYGQACRAVAYLRWQEGDADRIAPSLYATRGGTSKNWRISRNQTTR